MLLETQLDQVKSIQSSKRLANYLRGKAIYNLCVGCIVLISSIIDIQEDFYKIRKEHLLLVIGLIMIANAFINMYEAYSTLQRFAKEMRSRKMKAVKDVS